MLAMYKELVALKQSHQKGEIRGVLSVCSAHPIVLKAAMQMARSRNQPLLFEATASQVNQFGGYSGMTPEAFAALINQLSLSTGFSKTKFMVGADHLGPHIWKHAPSKVAMQKAEELVRQCVHAGFGKIHLDTTVGCADDPDILPLEVITRRAARLCQAAENVDSNHLLLYVIGNEVPTPGGGLNSHKDIPVTRPEQMLYALKEYGKTFHDMDLDDAFDRVIAMVVQPGVDFGDRHVSVYETKRASALSGAHEKLPGVMTYEIHSTDYQPPEALKQLVEDHFLILKVGPCLTFALRRVLFPLARMEAELPDVKMPSNLIQTMEHLMKRHPEYWQNHYKGTAEDLKYLRQYSLRDRIRYYWPLAEARAAVTRLTNNLYRSIPPDLYRQHLGHEYPDIEPDCAHFDPELILTQVLTNELLPYFKACCGF